MTGRRILDAAAIVKAVRGVASKHVAFRSHQLDVYSKTSTLAKAVQTQTERVTLTVKAASVLAGRFNEPASSASASKPETDSKASPVPSDVKVEREGKVQAERPGDVDFYENAKENSTVQPLTADDSQVDRYGAKRPPPSVQSDTPSKNVFEPLDEEGKAPSDTSKAVSEPSEEGEQRPAAPALPASKVSDKITGAHAKDELGASDQIGHTSPNIQSSQIQEQAVPEQDPLSDEAYSGIFRSPKIAKMLGGQHSEGAARERSKQQEAKNATPAESKSAQNSDAVSPDVQTPASGVSETARPSIERPNTTAANNNSGEDVHELAADMATDSDKVPLDTPDVSSQSRDIQTVTFRN